MATSQSLDPMGSSNVHGQFRSRTDLVFDGFRLSTRSDVGAARLFASISMGSWGRSSMKVVMVMTWLCFLLIVNARLQDTQI